MKKIVLLLLFAFVVCSCLAAPTNGIQLTPSDAKNMRFLMIGSIALFVVSLCGFKCLLKRPNPFWSQTLQVLCAYCLLISPGIFLSALLKSHQDLCMAIGILAGLVVILRVLLKAPLPKSGDIPNY